MTFIYFVLMISGLIFFHELGHYTFARLSKVHVVTFSIGFGPTLLQWKRKGTQYRLAAIPLGGYVKLLGDDPQEEVPPELESAAFLKKSLWHRFWIILGGPLFNLILPFILFFGIGLGTSHHAPSMVGAVSPDSPAARAGLMPGDRITEIDGAEIHYWWQLQEMIGARPGQELPIAFERDGLRKDSQIIPATVQRSLAPELGIINKVGRIGISHTYPLPIIAVRPGSPAESLGLENGDCIRTVDGQKVERWQDAKAAIMAKEGTAFKVVLQRNGPDSLRCIPDNQMNVVRQGVTRDALQMKTFEFSAQEQPSKGLMSGEFVVDLVEDESEYLTEYENPPPAKRWGLKPGDIILSADGRRCSVDGGVDESGGFSEPGFASWGEMLGHMHEYVDKTFNITVLRLGPFGSSEILSLEDVKLVRGSGKSEMNIEMNPVVFGAKPYTRFQRAVPKLVPNDHRFAYGIHLMTTESVEMIHLTVAAIFGLFTGDVSFKNLGGPIMVANLAGASRKHGWASFFRIMALLSISLGLFNLLPIPILDGGHLLFILIEAIQRKPISMRVRQTATFVGLAFIMLLIILVFKNDLERNWDSIMGFFGG